MVKRDIDRVYKQITLSEVLGRDTPPMEGILFILSHSKKRSRGGNGIDFSWWGGTGRFVESLFSECVYRGSSNRTVVHEEERRVDLGLHQNVRNARRIREKKYQVEKNGLRTRGSSKKAGLKPGGYIPQKGRP